MSKQASCRQTIKRMVEDNNGKLLTSEIFDELSPKCSEDDLVNELRTMICSGEIDVGWNGRLETGTAMPLSQTSKSLSKMTKSK